MEMGSVGSYRWKDNLLIASAAAQLLLGLPRFADGAYTDAKPLKFDGKFDPWKALEIPKSQDLPPADKVKKAFKKGALKWHPDRCARKMEREICEKNMEEVKLAQEVLSDDRKLQMWEAWDEDRRTGGSSGSSKGGGGRQPPPRPGGGADFGGGGMGDAFRNAFGPGGFGGTRQRPRPRPRKPQPPPRPPPAARPATGPAGAWREVSRRASEGVGGAAVEVITRERDLTGTPMVQVEVSERTCYKAQKECQEKVVERRRRRRDQEL